MEKKPTPMEKAGAFRCLNTSLELLEQAHKMMETARLLYPGMDPKKYNKVYNAAHGITVRCPVDTSTWEF